MIRHVAALGLLLALYGCGLLTARYLQRRRAPASCGWSACVDVMCSDQSLGPPAHKILIACPHDGGAL